MIPRSRRLDACSRAIGWDETPPTRKGSRARSQVPLRVIARILRWGMGEGAGRRRLPRQACNLLRRLCARRAAPA